MRVRSTKTDQSSITSAAELASQPTVRVAAKISRLPSVQEAVSRVRGDSESIEHGRII